MTTIGMTQGLGRMMAQPLRSRSIVQQVLLVCGILSSLTYVAADVLGGMRDEGYSFTSQAISELMATGAPSEAFVDPLFIAFGVLTLVFGVGVFREGAGRSRALRIAGGLMVGYAAIGFAGPTLFEMQQHGAGSLDSDLPHIVLTGVLVLLTLGWWYWPSRSGGVRGPTLDRITAPPVVHGGNDVVLGVPSYFSLGFPRPGPAVFFGSSRRAFGAPGAGGSFAFADPDARVGFAYVMNKLDFYLENDQRENALRDAVYRAIARLAARTRALEVVGARSTPEHPFPQCP